MTTLYISPKQIILGFWKIKEQYLATNNLDEYITNLTVLKIQAQNSSDIAMSAENLSGPRRFTWKFINNSIEKILVKIENEILQPNRKIIQ